MSCANHQVQDDNCTECRIAALDHEMDADMRWAIYARSALANGWTPMFSLEERKEMARKQGCPEPVE